MKEEIITKMSKFTITEQAILLITRKDLNEEQMNYLREILNSCEMDWSYFVGSLIYNRVNGIAYKNLVKRWVVLQEELCFLWKQHMKT